MQLQLYLDVLNDHTIYHDTIMGQGRSLNNYNIQNVLVSKINYANRNRAVHNLTEKIPDELLWYR